MGNRAVITTEKGWLCKENNLGIYLHWNGGRDSVEAFLTYCKMKGYRTPESDNYGWASLGAVITNFFGADGTSIGIDIVSRLDCNNFDNGVYIIKDWEIIDRKFFEGREQDQYDLKEMLLEIDKSMPENAQLGEEFISAEEIEPSNLKIGDKVFIQEIGGNFTQCEVVGFGEDKLVNGTNVNGIPYVNHYGRKCKGEDEDYSWNINNYIRTETVRVCKNQQGVEQQ